MKSIEKNALCSVEGCKNPKRGRGMCAGHYQRFMKGRSLEEPLQKHFTTPEAAFQARTHEQDGHILWTGSISDVGYGKLVIKKRITYAHRYAWERANGPIPKGMQVDHMCHNRSCVNVDHLRLATPAQNLSARRGAPSQNTSGIRNVSWSESRKRWRVRVQKQGKYYHGGFFKELSDAATAAQVLCEKVFGTFAGRG